jgi:proteasome lid subunit RPN8/RPN11
MAIRLSREQIAAIRQHGVREFPRECCGVLLGDVEDGVKVVREVRPLENTFAPDAEFEALAYEEERKAPKQTPEVARERRYLIAPEQMFALMREERQTGRKVLGFYHSHPNHPARPSIYDFKASFPWYSYLIISVQSGVSAELTAWQQDDEGRTFLQEDIQNE